MALIRAEQRGSRPLSRIYDGIVESAADLAPLAGVPAPGASGRALGPGSLLYCLETQSIYVKRSDGSWEEV